MAFQERNPTGGRSSEEWAGSLCLEVGSIFLLQVWSSMKGGLGIKGNKLPVRREEMDQGEEAAGSRWDALGGDGGEQVQGQERISSPRGEKTERTAMLKEAVGAP